LKNDKLQILFSTAIILLIAGSRLIPHTANFVPVFAMILFASVHLKNKWNAIFISIGALWLSDLYINNWGSSAIFFDQYDQETGQLLVDNFIFFSSPIQYLAYILIAFLGIQIFKNSISLPKVFGSSLLAGVIFFLVSNFGVWMHPLYMKSLFACYIDAIPFFRATLASNIFFSSILFGGYYLLQKDIHFLKLRHIKYSKF
jgi:hypothetical protein